VASPAISDAYLYGVDAASANDVWAVGSRPGNYDDTLIEHWDGALWSVVPSPNPGVFRDQLLAVAVGTTDNVWAVGWYETETLGNPRQTLMERYATVCISPTPAPTPTACAITFTDVLPGDYFYEAVRYLYCHGVIAGYGDGTFRPFNNTTRGQLAKIIVLAEGWTIYMPPTPTFQDVPATDPFYGVIETAYHQGIISGYNCGTG